MTSILEKAKEFAINGHNSINHKRKFSDEPYYVHCERVVKILKEVTNDEEVLAAAWLHDILEDVAPLNPLYSEKNIRELFGDRVCDFVIELTDSKLEVGNRATRKALDRARLEHASIEAKTIKLADLIDNFIDITSNDPNFSVVYTSEIGLLLPCLEDGNIVLLNKLTKLFKEYKK